MLKVLIHNPKFPRDRSKAVELTREQTVATLEYITSALNEGKKLKEDTVIQLLQEAGLPVKFDG